jgi:hypothetical protein
MDLLLLINGSKDKIIEANKLEYTDVDVVKIDEKDISHPKQMLKIINSKKYNNVFWGTIEDELQRFQKFMKLWILMSHSNKGGIIDESGNLNKFNTIKLLCIELPLLFIEAIVSIFIIIYFYLKLPVLKWRLRKS